MDIQHIHADKKRFLPLLLLGDEQESMIDRYLDRGDLYALYNDGLKAVCVVTDEGDGVFELKNLAVDPSAQRRGYGRTLIQWVCAHYRGRILQVGTGDSPLSVPFYLACGFTQSHRVPHFFIDHYDHPIVEGGVQLVDMIYFQKPLSAP